MDAITTADPYWRRLLHRWLVQYNPLYLLSAMLVLGGMILSSRGLAREGSLYGEIGVAAIAELYALTLIAGAALLMRIGQRRPGVMLALITVLYQCDLTLHTETCANLGTTGLLASFGWLAFFVVKLFALAWAMKIRLSRVAIALASAGATGAAVMPHALRQLDAREANAVVAVFLCGLFLLATLRRRATVTSTVDLDAWGRTVLRRTARASWIVFGVLLTGHLFFWSTQFKVGAVAIAPVVLLALVRRIESETRAWTFAGVVLATIAIAAPGAFSGAALVTAVALVMRLLPRMQMVTPPPSTETIAQPYRAAFAEVAEVQPPIEMFVAPSRAEQARLLVGSLALLYLSAWTSSWSGGDWPAHVLALDLALTALLVFGAWRARVRFALAPLGVTYAHALVVSGIVPTPRSLVGWGGSAVVLGFVILIASLAASYRLRRVVS